MDQAVLAIHFGEPPHPDPDLVQDYLARIFYQNADLEDAESEESARGRARELAQRRAPGLLEEYEAMGGSPMNEQARAQVEALAATLTDRGYEARAELAFQFLDPTIEDRLESMAADDIDRLALLPIYPLCGPSTTVAALDRTTEAIEGIEGWSPEVHAVAGWHRHPRYLRLRAENIRSFLDERGLDPADTETVLLFSAHGTPLHYLEEGSRYGVYVEETCEAMARLLGDVPYELGYQNHENRDIPWTSPDVETVVESLDADRVIVEPVSFMHEQSETIGELDDDLAEEATDVGLDFYRVPVPHDAAGFPAVLADLVEPVLAGVAPEMYQLRPCECAASADALCLNAPRR